MPYELPEIVDPEKISFCIAIPNEIWHIRAFWGAMWTLTRPYNWGDDEDHTALAVAQVWRDLWYQNFQDWETRECMTDPCCPDTNELLTKIINLLEGGMTADIRFNGGTTPPDTTAGDCAPVFFDHDDGETDPEVLGQREKALCITCERYVKAVLLTALQEMGTPTVLVDWVGSQIPQTVPLSLSKLTVVYPSFLEGLAAFFDALSGGMELEAIVCRMIAALSGDMNNTFTNFKNSLSDLTDDPAALLVPLIGLVSTTNGVKNNYMAFNEALEQANDEDLSAYSCPCEEPAAGYCDEPLDLTTSTTWSAGQGATITLVAPDVYHIVQNTSEFGSYYASIEESSGRCLKFEVADGYTFQSVLLYNWVGCCDEGDGEGGTGSFAGNRYTKIQWHATGDVPIDTYIKITCEDCCDEISLTDIASKGNTFEYIGECHYTVRQTTLDEDGQYHFSLAEVLGSCLKIENSTNPSFPTVGISYTDALTDCDDVTTDFTGGFTGSDNETKSVVWHQAPETLGVNHFKITLL